MFNSGVRTQDAGSDPWAKYASLIPLVETVGAALPGGTGFESPISGFCEMVKEQGVSHKMLGTAPGQGATALSALVKGTSLYARFMDDVRYANWRARQGGMTHKMRAFAWMQGEADAGNATYAATLNTLRQNISTDVKAITRQPEDVWCLSYQVGRAEIGLAHLAAQQTYSNIVVALAMYQLPSSDGTHLTAAGSKIAGAYFGLAYKRIILDGNTAWRPLMVTGNSVAGVNIDLTYNVPTGALAFDTTTVAAQTNMGFRLVDSVGGALTINSVSITGTNTIRIVAAASVPVGAKVYYGFSDPTNMVAATDKGNLRDTQGSTIVFDGGGLNYAMHNWALLQQVSLP